MAGKKDKGSDPHKGKPVTFTGKSGIGKGAFLTATRKHVADKITGVEAMARMWDALPPSEGVVFVTTNSDISFNDDALARRFTQITIPPLDEKLRAEIVLKMLQSGTSRLAKGVTEKKVSAVLQQKAFKDASIRDALKLLEKKGLIVRQNKPHAPKP